MQSGLLRRFQTSGGLSLNRIEVFSDGVIAILVTLLVLELHVPHIEHARSAGELAQALAALTPKFLSWVVSFLYVCVYWVNHHHVLRLARAADSGLVWLNNLVLLCLSFIPFPTALVGDYPTNAVAVGCFGVVLGICGLIFIALHAYIGRFLLRENVDIAVVRQTTRRSFIGPALFFGAADLAWLTPVISLVIYFIVPFLFIVPREHDDLTGTSSPQHLVHAPEAGD